MKKEKHHIYCSYMNKGYNLLIIHCKNEGSQITGNVTVVRTVTISPFVTMIPRIRSSVSVLTTIGKSLTQVSSIGKRLHGRKKGSFLA